MITSSQASRALGGALVAFLAALSGCTSLRVNLFYPGAVRTAMRAKAMPGEDPATLPMPADIVGRLIDMIEPSYMENRALFDLESGETRPA